MSRWLNVDPGFIPHVAKALNVAVTPLSSIVAEFDGDMPVAALIFDNFTGSAVHTHIWIAEGRKPSRMFWWAIYHYGFVQLGCKAVIGTVPGNNKAALKLNKHLGFVPKLEIPNYLPNGESMVLHVLTEESAPDWRKWQPTNTIEQGG